MQFSCWGIKREIVLKKTNEDISHLYGVWLGSDNGKLIVIPEEIEGIEVSDDSDCDTFSDTWTDGGSLSDMKADSDYDVSADFLSDGEIDSESLSDVRSNVSSSLDDLDYDYLDDHNQDPTSDSKKTIKRHEALSNEELDGIPDFKELAINMYVRRFRK